MSRLADALWRRRAALLRLILLLGLLAWPRPPAPHVLIGPRQTVLTEHPVVCVHTRLTDEVEEWKIQRTLAMVREMGAPWIVEYFPWAYLEREEGLFDWAHADRVIAHAANQGLSVIARLGLVPAWARPDPEAQPTIDSYLDEAHFADFGDFVYEFVARYRGRVGYVIVWNEPNLAVEWGYRAPDPGAYVELLKIAYARAKQADPSVQVLAGALAPTLEPPGSPWGMNDLAFLRAMYAAGGGRYFDILAVHAYGLASAPEAEPGPEHLNFRRAELARQVMIENGDAAKPIIVTEAGWNDSPRWTRAVRPAQRVEYTRAAYAYAEQRWPWAEAVCMWAFRYPAPANSYMDYYTFVTPEFAPKPVYEAVSRWTMGNDQ